MINIIEKLYLIQKNNLVYYDTLTKVKSKMYYLKVIPKKYKNTECLVIFIDIDNLKYINDTYGHIQGDITIQDLADKLLSLDNVLDICRYGGDEFILFTKLYFDITLLDTIDNISYGYHVKPKKYPIDKIVHYADMMMYRSKRKKKIKQ